MSEFKKKCTAPDLSPEAMRRLAIEMAQTRQRRAEALSRLGHYEPVIVLEKVIQELDFARIQIQDVHSDEGALYFIEEARGKIIAMLGIDKED